MRTSIAVTARTLAAGLLFSISVPAAASAAGASEAPASSPRIAMLWSSIRGDRSPKAMARHDLVLLDIGSLGLEFDRQPTGLAGGFTPTSIEKARKKVEEIRRLKPGIVLLGEIYFYEWSDRWLPEDHPWWLRKDGKREQFWPGTHRMDWNNPEYRARVAGWTASLGSSGVDGVFFDNLREESGPWVALLGEVRRRVGDRFLILANSGYAVGKHDFAAPFLNGFMYESGWSHGRTEWDSTIAAMRRSEELLRRPRISLIERFEDTGGRAGWPGDPNRGRKPPADPAARRWSLCYALIVGDYYYLFSDSTSHDHDWYPEYDVKIGGPASPGERLGPHAWRRRYDRALVAVNLPGAKEPSRVELEREATDVLTGEKGKAFEIPAGDGRILLLEGPSK
jgi:putative glycosyl hydrolase-like family 15 (GHL15) protein